MDTNDDEKVLFFFFFDLETVLFYRAMIDTFFSFSEGKEKGQVTVAFYSIHLFVSVYLTHGYDTCAE